MERSTEEIVLAPEKDESWKMLILKKESVWTPLLGPIKTKDKPSEEPGGEERKRKLMPTVRLIGD